MIAKGRELQLLARTGTERSTITMVRKWCGAGGVGGGGRSFISEIADISTGGGGGNKARGPKQEREDRGTQWKVFISKFGGFQFLALDLWLM